MYAFVAGLPESSATEDRRTPERLLSWKSLAWACDPANESVVSNVPRFLPGMPGETGPKQYRCEYVGGGLRQPAVASPVFGGLYNAAR